MLRVTAWTVGLFGAGIAISRAFASGWIEPLVLFALGVALLFVSRGSGATATAAAPAREPRAATTRLHEGALTAAARPASSSLRAPAVVGADPLALRAAGTPVAVPVEQSA